MNEGSLLGTFRTCHSGNKKISDPSVFPDVACYLIRIIRIRCMVSAITAWTIYSGPRWIQISFLAWFLRAKMQFFEFPRSFCTRQKKEVFRTYFQNCAGSLKEACSKSAGMTDTILYLSATTFEKNTFVLMCSSFPVCLPQKPFCVAESGINPDPDGWLTYSDKHNAAELKLRNQSCVHESL